MIKVIPNPRSDLKQQYIASPATYTIISKDAGAAIFQGIVLHAMKHRYPGNLVLKETLHRLCSLYPFTATDALTVLKTHYPELRVGTLRTDE